MMNIMVMFTFYSSNKDLDNVTQLSVCAYKSLDQCQQLHINTKTCQHKADFINCFQLPASLRRLSPALLHSSVEIHDLKCRVSIQVLWNQFTSSIIIWQHESLLNSDMRKPQGLNSHLIISILFGKRVVLPQI